MSFFNLHGAHIKALLSKQAMLDPNGLPLQARAIRIINVFRFVLSLVFVIFYLFLSQSGGAEREGAKLYFSIALAYSVFSVMMLIINPFKTKALTYFHPVQIVIDIIFILLMMAAAGGVQSGLGLLLIITIVTASLVSDGRLSLFYAAVATIGLLLEHSYQMTKSDLSASTYTQPVMLSLSCFATAWLAYSLAKRVLQSEALASARGIDLENLEQINALITQEMHDGVIVVDQSANIRYHNAQADSLLGVTLQKSNLTFLNTHAPEIVDAFNDWISHTILVDYAIIMINNRELRLRFESIYPLNRQLGTVIFMQDWSQMQSIAQQTKLAALGRLTANIAHEIRNPLSAISHANQLLQEDNTNSANTRVLQIVADNVVRIEGIITDVLELNRRDRIQQETILLSQMLTDFYHQFCTVERIPTLHFEYTLLPNEESILFDHRHLTQILWNLCKNGWEHSHKKAGSLNLTCRTIGDSTLMIEVRDDGYGVAEKDRNKLFEPFYTTKTTGNGLGLYISRELAEANGATLGYQALDVGSAFILQFKKQLT
ncbi:MAG: sensor histidine kinase [Methylotenera sp.]|nr:sensor histidine kinase [Methylotenera sp.]